MFQFFKIVKFKGFLKIKKKYKKFKTLKIINVHLFPSLMNLGFFKGPSFLSIFSYVILLIASRNSS